jgi:cysteine desulfurase / selenocysteine lyase
MSLKNFSQIKEDFDLPPVTYLDNAATAFMPYDVLAATNEYYTGYKANIHRGIHRLSELATREYETVREKVCKLINANKTREIVFTSGTTHSINILASGLTNRFNDNDAILVCESEHHANLLPWMNVSYKTNCRFEPINIIKDGRLDLGHLEDTCKSVKGKIIFCLAHISNTTGYEHDLKTIIDIVHNYNGYVVIDAAQSISKRKIDVQELDIDFLVFSSHKLYGPTGSGVLYGKIKLLDKVEPLMLGGDMISYVHWDSYGLAEMPYKLEAGTPNIAGVIGMGAAIDWFMSYGVEQFEQHDRMLSMAFSDMLNQLEYVKIFHPGQKSGLISFAVQDVHPQDLSTFLDLQNIAIRSGFMCAQPAVEEFFKDGLNRLSWGCYNTVDQAQELKTALDKCYERLAYRRQDTAVH